VSLAQHSSFTSVVVGVAVCGAAYLGACETTGRPTWDDLDELPATARTPPTTTSQAHGSQDINQRPAAHPSTSSGVLIDRALVDLNAARARARQQGRTSPLWSEAWLDSLARIDDALSRAPIATDLGAFVRARVTLEVELQNDRERGVLLPGTLEQAVQRTLVGVDESVAELRAANAPGTIAPSPRLSDDELTLHASLAPIVVNSPFGRRIDPFTGAPRFHAGVDIDAPVGAAVYASAAGIVVYAGPQGGYGRYVVLDHGDGIRTHYAHLSAINVSVGAFVAEGEVIGAVGSTGRSTGPHLHFAVTDELGAFLDPVGLLDIPYKTIAAQVARRGEAAAPASDGAAAPAPDGG